MIAGFPDAVPRLVNGTVKKRFNISFLDRVKHLNKWKKIKHKCCTREGFNSPGRVECCGVDCRLVWVPLFLLLYCRSLNILNHCRNILKLILLSGPSDRNGVSKLWWIVPTDVIKMKRAVITSWIYHSGEKLITSYCGTCKFVSIFNPPKYKFCRLFLDNKIPKRLKILLCIAIIEVWLWSENYVSMFYLTFPCCLHKWRC